MPNMDSETMTRNTPHDQADNCLPDGLTTSGLKSNSQIVEKVPVGDIMAPPWPLKPPSSAAITLCMRNMERYGHPCPILVDDDRTVIEGLEFVAAAHKLGWTHINVVRVSGLSGIEARALALTLAKLPELSDWDEDALRMVIEDVISFDSDILDLTGFSMGEIDLILDPQSAEPAENPLDALPDLSPDGKIVSRAGDVFLLGDNRILCGDSQKPDAFNQLLDSEKARAVITDPPYNIQIANNVSGLGKTKHDDFAMAVGEMSFDTFSAFLKTMFAQYIGCLLPGGLIYVFMDRRHLEELFAAARLAGLTIVDLAIWGKMSGGMGGLYRSQYEPCAVFKSGNHPHLNNVQLGKYGRYRTNVWQHRGLSSFGKGRAEALAAHPTVKPVNLLAEIVKDCTRRGDIIVDPFLGSGSTILAAQKTGRRCFGIELEPGYVDIAIKRWEAMTGGQAVHTDSGLTFAELRALRHARAQDSLASSAASPVGADHAE